MTKSELASAIEAETGIKTNLVKRVLDSLADTAVGELEAGHDFTVPGVVKLTYTYRAPQKKGAKYKKGDTYTGFGGVEQVAEDDSKPVTEQIKLKAAPTGAVARLRPGSNAERQAAFMKTKTAKAVKARKSR